jgi:hypothetical protein
MNTPARTQQMDAVDEADAIRRYNTAEIDADELSRLLGCTRAEAIARVNEFNREGKVRR